MSLSRGISPWASGLSQGRRYRGATGTWSSYESVTFFTSSPTDLEPKSSWAESEPHKSDALAESKGPYSIEILGSRVVEFSPCSREQIPATVN